MNIEEIRKGAPGGAQGYIIGRVTKNIIYVKENMVWCYATREWTSFVHNMDIKPL